MIPEFETEHSLWLIMQAGEKRWDARRHNILPASVLAIIGPGLYLRDRRKKRPFRLAIEPFW